MSTGENEMALGCIVRGAQDLRVEPVPPIDPPPGFVAVDVAYGGICGSDLHYVHRGAVGDFALREPLVLGHEVVGHLSTAGSETSAPLPGAPVAVHPATPCDDCDECAAGHRNVCADSRYLGSAARFPHVQGGFATRISVPASQIRVLPPELALHRAVLAEPFAVALHAVARAGDVRGRRVLVTGAGPIGNLVVAALRHAGAADIVVVDLVNEALTLARQVGATRTLHVDDVATAEFGADVAIEASGTPTALGTCLRRVRRRGRVVLLGLLPTGETPFLGNLAVTRELDLVGAFRFDHEFDEAIRLLAGDVGVDRIITHVLGLSEASEAFALATDRTRASKVVLDLRR